MRKVLIVLTVAALAVFASGCEKGSPRSKARGRDFTLNDPYGNPVSLKDYRGKVVMLEFFASWCAPCRQSAPELTEIHETYKDRGFALIAISVGESPEKVRDFKEEFDIPYTVVIDDMDVNSSYGVMSIPTTLLLDREGNVALKHLGFARGVGADLAKEIEKLL
jgi:peroxiredoxin